DSRDSVLDRIFDGDDVDAAMLQQPECGVKRRRLSRTGWPGDEDEALPHLEQFLHTRAVNRIEPKRLDRAKSSARIKYPDHNFFAVRCRQCRDTQVHAGSI